MIARHASSAGRAEPRRPRLPGAGSARRAGPPLALAAFVLLAWEGAVRLGEISASVLPAPTRVGQTLLSERASLWHHASVTLLETGLGFALALLTAVVLAVAVSTWGTVRRAVYPWLVASQTIPIIALAPLMLVWFGFGLLPKVLLVALFCFFPMVVATADGLSRTDPELLKLMRSMRAGRWRTLRLVRAPAALPSFFSGLRIAATYSVTAAVFAEYTGGFAGLGILMQTAANARATPLVFAAIVVTALASFAIFASVALLERIFVPWATRGEDAT